MVLLLHHNQQPQAVHQAEQLLSSLRSHLITQRKM
jgi:hypothetical protein